MSTIERRLTDIEARLSTKRPTSVIEETRAMLESVDGQPELDMRPDEDLFTVTRRRVQVSDGWDLSGLPGDTLEAKEKSADLCAHGMLSITPEARHAARHWLELYAKV